MTTITQRLKEMREADAGTKLVREWKHFWMNQKQNSQEDYEAYYRRAVAVDANMTHHLGDLIDKEHKVLITCLEKAVVALEKVEGFHEFESKETLTEISNLLCAKEAK